MQIIQRCVQLYIQKMMKKVKNTRQTILLMKSNITKSLVRPQCLDGPILDAKTSAFPSETEDSDEESTTTFTGLQLWNPIWLTNTDLQSPYSWKKRTRSCLYCGKKLNSDGSGTIQCKDPLGRTHSSHVHCQTAFASSKLPLLLQRCSAFYSTDAIKDHADQIGAPEFLMGVKMQHMIGSWSYFEGYKKVKQINGSLTWNSSISEQQGCMLWDGIIIANLQFKISIQIQKLKNGDGRMGDKKLFFQARLSLEEGKNQKILKIFDEILIEIDFEVCLSNEQKQSCLQTTNRKIYPLNYSTINLVKVQKIRISPADNETYHLQQPQHQNMSQAILSYLQTQEGSKYYQQIFVQMNHNQKIEFLRIIQPHIPSLIMHEYGNYFIQRVCQQSTFQQRSIIYEVIENLIPNLVCEIHGTFVFQSLLQKLQELEEFIFFSQSIRGQFKYLSCQPNATHFIRKLMEVMPIGQLDNLVGEMDKSFIDVAVDKNSICVMKIFVKKAFQTQAQQSLWIRNYIVQKIKQNIHTLICSQYGNYLIQEILEKVPFYSIHDLHQDIALNFAKFVFNKYASIVLAKCISKYWKGIPQIYSLTASYLVPKKISSMQKDREAKKVYKEILNSQDPATWALRKKLDQGVNRNY